MKTLYIVRGLPGSGKTTFIESITQNYVEADMYHEKVVDGKLIYDWKPENVSLAHQWCYNQVEGLMEMGEEKIAVSNTNTTEKEFKKYIELANDFGYRYHVITVENYHGGENTHNVPEKTLEKMENRYTLRLRNKTTKVNK